MTLRRLARRIRHSAWLKDFDPIWNILRKPYQRILDPAGRGIRIRLAGRLVVRLPREYAGQSWEEYEPETMAALIDFLRGNPRSVVLDIGCSSGIFSLAALFADETCLVVGVDGDLASVAAARRLCAHAPDAARLSVVRGLIAERGAGATLAEAIETTREDLRLAGATGDIGTTRYIMLDSPGAETLPHYSIDGLFATSDLLAGRPVLLKCDVEGAELQVLRGASCLLADHDVTVLLSVHPEVLPSRDSSPGDIRDCLERQGYCVTILAIDHEEHWLCAKSKRRPPAATLSA